MRDRCRGWERKGAGGEGEGENERESDVPRLTARFWEMKGLPEFTRWLQCWVGLRPRKEGLRRWGPGHLRAQCALLWRVARMQSDVWIPSSPGSRAQVYPLWDRVPSVLLCYPALGWGLGAVSLQSPPALSLQGWFRGRAWERKALHTYCSFCSPFAACLWRQGAQGPRHIFWGVIKESEHLASVLKNFLVWERGEDGTIKITQQRNRKLAFSWGLQKGQPGAKASVPLPCWGPQSLGAGVGEQSEAGEEGGCTANLGSPWRHVCLVAASEKQHRSLFLRAGCLGTEGKQMYLLALSPFAQRSSREILLPCPSRVCMAGCQECVPWHLSPQSQQRSLRRGGET